jgi:hypothetical protein
MIQQSLIIKSHPQLEREIRGEIAYKRFLLSAVILKLMTNEKGIEHAKVANEKIINNRLAMLQ